MNQELGQAMRAGGAMLAATAAGIDARRAERLRGIEAIASSGARGGAVTVALGNLGAYADQLAQPSETLRAVAQTLSQYGLLRQRVDNLLRLVRQFHSKEALRGPVLILTAIGQAIDFMCAREIDALCTPALGDPPARLEDFEGMTTAAIHQLHMLTAAPEVVALMERNPDARILEASEGRLVAVVAPPRVEADSALTRPASVTTFVNGVGSSDPAGWNGTLERARTMAAATGGPVVAWMGYNAPPTLAHGVASGPAAAAGRELGRFQRSLTQRYPSARHVVVGYSYGSLVAGQAASRGGLRADELVLVGSPGVGVDNASELDVRGPGGPGRVHAVTALDDPIALTTSTADGLHGADPAGLGFKAKPWPTRLRGDHGSYFTNPEFLSHLGDLARGRG